MGSVLLVGEGDFSFSVAFLRHPQFATITSSTLLSRDELCRLHKRAEVNTAHLLTHGVEVLYEVDATQLHSSLVLDGRRFTRIMFNFPHVGGKSNIKKNRQLLREFFHSAVQKIEEEGDIVVTLAQGQGGTPADEPIREWHDSWQIVGAAAESGLLLSRVQPFDTDLYSEYTSTGFRSKDQAFFNQRAMTYTFEKERVSCEPGDTEGSITVGGRLYNTVASVSDVFHRQLLCEEGHPVNRVLRQLRASLTTRSSHSTVSSPSPVLRVRRSCDHCDRRRYRLTERPTDAMPHSPSSLAPENPSSLTSAPENPSSLTSASENPSSLTSAPENPSSLTSASENPSSLTSAPENSSSLTLAPENPSSLTSASENPSSLTSAPENPSSLTSAPENSSSLTSAPVNPSSLTSAPENSSSLTLAPENPSSLTSAPENPSSLTSAPENSSSLTLAPENPSSLTSAPENSSSLTLAPENPSSLTSAPENPSSLTSAPENPSSLTSAPENPSSLTLAPENPSSLTSAPENLSSLTSAPENPSSLTSATEPPSSLALRISLLDDLSSMLRDGVTPGVVYTTAGAVYRRPRCGSSHGPVQHHLLGALLPDTKLEASGNKVQASDTALQASDTTLQASDSTLQASDSTLQSTVIPLIKDLLLEALGDKWQILVLESDLGVTECCRPLERVSSVEVAGRSHNMQYLTACNQARAKGPVSADNVRQDVKVSKCSRTVGFCGTLSANYAGRENLPPNLVVFVLKLDAIAQVKFDIPDTRYLWSLDSRFTSQFSGDVLSPSFTPLSLYPPLWRHDLSFWDAPHTEFDECRLLDIVRSVGGRAIKEVLLMNVWREPGSGRVSRCYRVVYQAVDTALSRSTAHSIQNTIRLTAQRLLEVQLR